MYPAQMYEKVFWNDLFHLTSKVQERPSTQLFLTWRYTQLVMLMAISLERWFATYTFSELAALADKK